MGNNNISADYDSEGYQRLAAAVVEKAIQDYRSALKRLYRRPNDHEAERLKNDCERFFQNEIEIYSDIDGTYIMEKIQKMVTGEMQSE